MYIIHTVNTAVVVLLYLFHTIRARFFHEDRIVARRERRNNWMSHRFGLNVTYLSPHRSPPALLHTWYRVDYAYDTKLYELVLLVYHIIRKVCPSDAPSTRQYEVYVGVYHTRRRFSVLGISMVGIVSVPRRSAWEMSRQELSERVSFGVGTSGLSRNRA